jgi:hypothetical protein
MNPKYFSLRRSCRLNRVLHSFVRKVAQKMQTEVVDSKSIMCATRVCSTHSCQRLVLLPFYLLPVPSTFYFYPVPSIPSTIFYLLLQHVHHKNLLPGYHVPRTTFVFLSMTNSFIEATWHLRSLTVIFLKRNCSLDILLVLNQLKLFHTFQRKYISLCNCIQFMYCIIFSQDDKFVQI